MDQQSGMRSQIDVDGLLIGMPARPVVSEVASQIERPYDVTGKSRIESIKLSEIVLDDSFQIRVELSTETIEEYAELMSSEVEFPPIDIYIFNGSKVLVNGRHRVEAARKCGLESIHAIILEGDARQALLHAIRCDATSALKRTNADKQKAVRLLLADSEWSLWSDVKIAGQAGVSDRFVASVRKSLTSNGSMLHDSVKVSRAGVIYSMAKRKPSHPPASRQIEVGCLDANPRVSSVRSDLEQGCIALHDKIESFIIRNRLRNLSQMELNALADLSALIDRLFKVIRADEMESGPSMIGEK